MLPDELPTAGTAKPAATERRVIPASGRRILVVDDNRDAAESLAMLLRLFGNDAHLVKPVDLKALQKLLSQPELAGHGPKSKRKGSAP